MLFKPLIYSFHRIKAYGEDCRGKHRWTPQKTHNNDEDEDDDEDEDGDNKDNDNDDDNDDNDDDEINNFKAADNKAAKKK